MRRLVLLCLTLFPALGLGPVARGSDLLELSTADQMRAYTAVGRLELDGRGFCTATLVATDLVLTAAHCLYEKGSSDRVPLDGLTFHAGLRNGRAEATRRVRRAAVHGLYQPGDPDPVTSVSTDLALIELDQPIRNGRISPLPIERARMNLSEVALVSYAKDRAQALSLERSCDVLARHASVQVLSCDVDFGASGAPVFVMDRGMPKVVAVVSAKANWDGEKVALVAGVEDALDALRRTLREGKTLLRASIPQIGTSASSDSSGAKFLRP